MRRFRNCWRTRAAGILFAAALVGVFSAGCGRQTALVPAQLFLTGTAAQCLVALLVKPLRMACMDDLPADKKHGSQRTGGDRQRSAHGQKGRAEHQIVPVIDAAGGAAAVMHPESLEGTEKEDAVC